MIHKTLAVHIIKANVPSVAHQFSVSHRRTPHSRPRSWVNFLVDMMLQARPCSKLGASAQLTCSCSLYSPLDSARDYSVATGLRK